MDRDYSLTVVICAVDETFSLERTFRKLDGYGGVDEYMFVLSQACSRECLDTVKQLCKRGDCKWRYQTGKGLGNALREAFENAGGDHIAIWSADEGTDTASFPIMLKLSRENPEKIVKISRWLQKDGFDGYGGFKKILNFISQRVFALMFHSGLTEFTNPTQIAPAAVYRQIRWKHNGFDFLPELIFKPLKLGVEFMEVPTKNVPREEGRSRNKLLSHIFYYTTVLGIFFTPKKKLEKEE